MKQWFSLDDTTAIVAGHQGLLGKTCLKALKECGAEVVGIDIDEVDLTNEKSLKGFFSKLKTTSSKNWAFINCTYPRTANWGKLGFENFSLDDWNKNVELHLGSAFLFTQQSVAFLQKTGGGSIINFGSIYGVAGPDLRLYEGTEMKNPAAYAAIKSGIVGLTRYVATAFGHENIRANVVCPGGVKDKQPEKFVKAYSQKTPLGRMAKPEEVAGVVAFLAGPSASYITGQVLLIDGGWTAW